ncbi:MAG: hypothetical protein AMXMBFR13_15820 [Phycisphaerae bacterium]
MRRSQLLLLSMISTIVAERPLWAQERPNGFFFTSPLSLSAGYDHNFISNSRSLDDKVAIITTPALSWIKSTHRARLSTDYQAEFETFSRHQDLNAWNHEATLRYSYRINARWTADAGNSFLSTSDPSRRLAESQLLLPRGRYQQNAFFTGLRYRLNYRTSMSIRFDNAITAMSLPSPRSNLSDQMTSAGSYTIDHTVNRRHSVTGSYAYLRIRPLDQRGSVAFSYQPIHNVTSGYRYTVNPGLNFRLTGGAVRGRELAYTAGGAVEKRVRGLSVMASYQRYLSFLGGFGPAGGISGGADAFANPLLPDSVFQALSVRVRGKLTRRIGLEIYGQRGQMSLAGQRIRSLIGQSRVDYQLTDRLIIFARAEYFGQNVSQFADLPLSRQRYFGGLEIVLSRPPEQENAQLRHRGIFAEPSPRQSSAPQEAKGK